MRNCYTTCDVRVTGGITLQIIQHIFFDFNTFLKMRNAHFVLKVSLVLQSDQHLLCFFTGARNTSLNS